jgi:hypothetical protein
MRYCGPADPTARTVAVREARRHLDGGRPDRAAAVLRRHLADVDPDTAADDPVLVEAACLYAETLDGEPDTRLRWAAYAFGAGRRLHDTYHPTTLWAARILVQLAQQRDVACRVPVPEYRGTIADGTSILRAYLTKLVGGGRAVDARMLARSDRDR